MKRINLNSAQIRFSEMRAKVSSEVIKSLRTVRPTQEEHLAFNNLHQQNISDMMNNRDDEAFIKIYNNLNDNETLNNIKKYGYKKVYSTSKQIELVKRAAAFYDICVRNESLFGNSNEDKLSVYMTAIGFKPSCLLSKDLANTLLNINSNLFKDFFYIDTTKTNNGEVQFVNPKSMRNVIEKNPDIFEPLSTNQDIKEYLQKVNATNYYKDLAEKECKDRNYKKQLRSGLMLGIPKSTAIEFAGYQIYLDKYMDCNDEYYTLLIPRYSLNDDDFYEERPEDLLTIVKDNYFVLKDSKRLSSEAKERERIALMRVPEKLPNVEMAKVISTIRIMRISDDYWINLYSLGSIERNFMHRVCRLTRLLKRRYLKDEMKRLKIEKH